MSKTGWKGESQRHSMAKRGIKSKHKKLKYEGRNISDIVKDMFKPGAVGYGKPYYDEDWFRYYPNGTWESHELCTGCETDGSCPFHPPGCQCSHGECLKNRFNTEYNTISYPKPDLLPKDIKEELIHEFKRSIRFDMTNNQAIQETVEYIVSKMEDECEVETGLMTNVTTPTYHAMEKYLLQYANRGE